MNQRYIVEQALFDDAVFQIIDTLVGVEFAICENSFDRPNAKAAAEYVANALNFADRWRGMLSDKIKACERHQRERPDRADKLDNTRRVLTELLTEAGEEWGEQLPI